MNETSPVSVEPRLRVAWSCLALIGYRGSEQKGINQWEGFSSCCPFCQFLDRISTHQQVVQNKSCRGLVAPDIRCFDVPRLPRATSPSNCAISTAILRRRSVDQPVNQDTSYGPSIHVMALSCMRPQLYTFAYTSHNSPTYRDSQVLSFKSYIYCMPRPRELPLRSFTVEISRLEL